MPDEEGNTGSEGVESPLHAYQEGREEAVEGDPTGQDVVEGSPKQTEPPEGSESSES